MAKDMTLQITLQHPRNDRWPVSATFDSSDGLPYRQEGELSLSKDWETELRALMLNPEQYGEYLGKVLFREGIRDISKRAESSIQPSAATGDDVSEPDVVHLFLNVEAKELQTLRWERLAYPEDGGGWVSLAQHQRLVFSYYFPSLVSRQYPALNKHGLKALAFIASPQEAVNGYKPFDVSATVATLQKGFGNIPLTVMADPSQGSWEALRDELNQRHYPILHIVAHGFYQEETGESYLILLDKKQKPQAVSTTTLIDQLKRMNGQLPNLIVLSSCETATPEASQGAHNHLARRLLDELGTPAIVAMSDKVQIETAYLLSEHFYAYLHKNAHVDIALATAGMALINCTDRHLPVLYHRLGSRPLFTQEDRPLEQLDQDDIQRGLFLLGGEAGDGGLLAERAPILREEYRELVGKLNTTHPDIALLNKLDSLCQEVTEIGFAALTQGEPVSRYDASCPFPGMRPFKQSENGVGTDYRKYFFGRDQKVVELCQRLEQLDTLMIKGASGSGKSSIVYAGVLPELTKRYQTAGKPLQSATMRPRCIRNADQSITSPHAQLLAIVQELDAGKDAIIFIDQFEELFTTCQSDDPHQQKQVHQQFLDELLGIPQQHPGWKVILTMRADFTGDCAAYEDLRQIVQNQAELLPAMSMDELRTAIEEQAKSVGLITEGGLLHAILDEVEDQPGAMPLLQYLLWLLWKRRRGRYLLMKEYEKIQKVGNAISEIADTHYHRYDNDPLAQSYLRNIYLRLTRPDTDRQQQAGAEKYRDTRQRINQRELYPKDADPKLIRQLIQELADADHRLIVTYQDEVEIAHETLIQHWPLLDRLLNDPILNLIRQSIANATRDWAAETHKNRKNSLLTHTGTRLQDIEKYKQDELLFTNAQEEAYLQACYAKDQRQSRNQRYVRVFAGAMLLLFLIAGWVSWFAIGQKNRADDRLAEQHFQKGIELRDNANHELGEASSYFAKALDVVADKTIKENIEFSYEEIERFASLAIGQSMRHKHNVNGTELFAGDTKVLTWDRDDTLHVWNIANGIHVGQPMHHVGLNGAMMFADDTRVLTWGGDGSARLWDATTGVPVGTPMLHKGAVEGATLFASDNRVLTWSSDGIAQIWDVASGVAIGQPMLHKGAVRGATLFAGDNRVLTWSDNTAQIWDVASGVAIGQPMLHKGAVRGATLFAGDNRVLTWSDNTAQIWDASNGTVIGQSMSHEKVILGVALFADDTRVLTWSGDNTARIWDASSGAAIGQPMRHGLPLLSDTQKMKMASNATFYRPPSWEDDVMGAALFADDSRILTWGADGTARIWDASNGTPIGSPMYHEALVRGCTLFADDTRLLTWSNDGTVRVWNIARSTPAGRFILQKESVNGAALFANDTRILTWSNSSARIRDIATGAAIGQPMRHEKIVKGATLFANNTRVLTWSKDNTARIWDAASGAPVGQPMRHKKEVLGVKLSADNTRVLTWSGDNTTQVWDAASGIPVGQLMQSAGEGRLVGATFFAGDTRVLTWNASSFDLTGNGFVQFWDAANGTTVGQLIEHPKYAFDDWLVGATLFADNTRLLSWGHTFAHVWDVTSGEAIGDHMFHGGTIIGAKLFAGDTRILTWSRDNTARIWEASSGIPVGQPMQHKDTVQGATIFANDSRILTWSDDGTVRVWDTTNGFSIGQPMRHEDKVAGIQLFAKNTRVLTWSDDTVKIWDVASGVAIGQPMRHSNTINGVTLFANNTQVLTWSDDNTVRIWELPIKKREKAFLYEIKQSIQSQHYFNTAGDWMFLTPVQLTNCQSKYAPFEQCEDSDTLSCTLKRQWWSVEKFLGKLPTIEDCVKG